MTEHNSATNFQNKMNTIKRRFPNFIDAPPEARGEIPFDTTEQLLEIDWIKRWAVSDQYRQHIQFSRTDEARPLLMVEYFDHQEGCKSFSGLGYFKNDNVDLPIFKDENY